jgi:hypothetical protein
MKKKNRKRRKRNLSARHEPRTVHAKRRERTQKKRVESASPPWLRILSSDIENDPSADVSGGLLSRPNGRHQAQDLDPYVPEDDSRSR